MDMNIQLLMKTKQVEKDEYKKNNQYVIIDYFYVEIFQ